jgi:hypothetical protein
MKSGFGVGALMSVTLDGNGAEAFAYEYVGTFRTELNAIHACTTGRHFYAPVESMNAKPFAVGFTSVAIFPNGFKQAA